MLLMILKTANALDFPVTNINGSGPGSLSQAISDLNNSGASGNDPALNTITFNAGLGTIFATGDLPVITKPVTIQPASGTQVISGATSGAQTTPAFRLLATYKAPLALNNLTLQYGLAQGGNGASFGRSGGGGLGAGGAVYIDPGLSPNTGTQSLTLTNVSFLNCVAVGGAGGAGSNSTGSGGGGGASFTRNANKTTVTQVGGGDAGGSGITGGSVTNSGYADPNPPTTTLKGYGGGRGGADALSTGGAGGGDGAGSAGVTTQGGAGGYCGGGGGSVDPTQTGVGAGGGGGNGGGNGVDASSRDGGGGGSYGSGGGGGVGSFSALGGGGGFGGGGGGGANSGGGGGGFGGGGGSVNGQGGAYGGAGAPASQVGVTNLGGGGGAAIGGTLFIGDGARLILKNTTSITRAATPLTGGSAGTSATAGSTLAPDVFLFKGASVLLNGSSNMSLGFAINGDVLNATAAANKDAGITVNTTGGAVVTLGSSADTYQGNITVTSGTLQTIGANLPGNNLTTAGNIIVQTGATFALTGGTFPTNTLVNNQSGGTSNISGTFAPLAGSINAGSLNILSSGAFTAPASFNNASGSIYVTGTGTVAGTIASGVSFNIGRNSAGAGTNTTFSTTAAITSTSINIYTGSSLATTGGGSVAGNLFVVGTGTFSSTAVSGSTLTTGADSSGTVFGSTAFSAGAAISGFPSINVVGGTFTNNAFPVTNINTAFTIANGTTATLNGSFTGNATALNSTNSGTLNILSTFGLAGFTNNSGAIMTLGTNAVNNTPITNAGTLNVTGTNVSNTVTITNNNIMSVTGTISTGGGSIANAAALTFTGANNTNPITNNSTGTFTISTTSTNNAATISNSGTMNINAGFTSGTITNTATGNLFLASAASNINSNIINQASGHVSVNSQATVNSANTITNSGIMSIAAQLAGGGAISNNNGGTLTLTTNANNTRSIVNASGATLLVNANVTTSGIVNNGAMSIAGNINMAGQNLATSGANSSVTVSGQRTLTATSYTNTGKHIITVTDASTADSLTVSGTASLGGGGTLQVNSSFVGAIGVPYQWTILSAPGGVSPPTNTMFPSESWSTTVSGGNALILHFLLSNGSYVDPAVGPVNIAIGEVLNDMANNITNSGQQQLIDAVNSVLGSPDYNYYIHQFMPSINVSSAMVGAINATFNQTINRASKTNKGNNTGIATGEINPDTSVWIAGIADFIRQNARGENQGFRANVAGGLLGIDTLVCGEDVVGAALGFTNANVYDFSNSNFTSRVLTYYGLLYGSAYLDRNFLEWTIGGGTNKNTGNRAINIGSTNLSISSSYRGAQAGIKMNLGNSRDIADIVTFSHFISVQDVWLYQPAYDENGSVAALHVANKTNSNILTLGTGIRLAGIDYSTWQRGLRELHMGVTYDVLNPNQVTTANFIVGSNNFAITSVPERLAFQVGADYTVTFCDNLQLSASYDFEYRSKYYNQLAQLKLRYVF